MLYREKCVLNRVNEKYLLMIKEIRMKGRLENKVAIVVGAGTKGEGVEINLKQVPMHRFGSP